MSTGELYETLPEQQIPAARRGAEGCLGAAAAAAES